MTIIDDRRKALLERVREYGGPLNEPAVFVQFMAQVMHESGGLRYVREIWGPTKAQARYEGRKDLGNVKAGDGKRYMGRDVIQITGRANYRALSKWAGFDFEAKPEALEAKEWMGIGAIWYFLRARPKLIQYCRDGNIEMVTRQVNGGLNGYADRLKWYDKLALEHLEYDDVRSFQKACGLVVDGISGPKTRVKMHECLSHKMTAPISKPATAPKKAAQAQKPAAPSSIKETGKSAAGGLLGGGVALGVVALWDQITAFFSGIAAKWEAFWVAVFSLLN